MKVCLQINFAILCKELFFLVLNFSDNFSAITTTVAKSTLATSKISKYFFVAFSTSSVGGWIWHKKGPKRAKRRRYRKFGVYHTSFLIREVKIKKSSDVDQCPFPVSCRQLDVSKQAK